MNLAILCASLEPRKDGVGDYIRHMALELTKLGHKPNLIALNDKHTTKVARETKPSHALRLPTTLSSAQKLYEIRNFTEDNINHASLQFVPFSYSKRGILKPHTIAFFRELGNILPITHIFFHELWLGLSQTDTVRNKIIGYLQKRKLLSLISFFESSIISVSNLGYQTILQKSGITSNVLPLFSNIPIHQHTRQVPENNEIRFVTFGSIHPEWDSSHIFESAIEQNFRPTLAILGRSGPTKEKFIYDLLDQFGNRLQIKDPGELPSPSISAWLQDADIGLSSMPIQLIEKSGSYAAMKEHGLPVIATRDDWKPHAIPNKPPLPLNPTTFLHTATSPVDFKSVINSRKTPSARSPLVAKQFLELLSHRQ